MGNPDVFVVCTHLRENEAAYRRVSYFVKYFRLRGLRVFCVGFLRFSEHGVARPSSECYGFPLFVSTQHIANSLLKAVLLLLNTVLSLTLAIIILVFRPRIVLLSVPGTQPVIATYLGCLLAKSKLIIDVRDPKEEIIAHTYKKGLPSLVAKIYKRINYSIYRRANAIVGVTRTLITMLANAIRRSVYLAPNGADLEIFKPIDRKEARRTLGLNQNSFLIAYIGDLTIRGYYNVLPVLTAIKKVREKTGIDVELVVAGPVYGREAESVIEGFKDVLRYMGVFNAKGVVTLLSACDVGVIPRIKDPVFDYAIPAKVYEYIATGLPVIVTANRESELAKIVNENKLGLVCEPGDQVCLENAITTLATNKDLLDELRRNVLAFRSRVDRRIGAERLYRLINELLEG